MDLKLGRKGKEKKKTLVSVSLRVRTEIQFNLTENPRNLSETKDRSDLERRTTTGKSELYLILVVKEKGVLQYGAVHVNPGVFLLDLYFYSLPNWASFVIVKFKLLDRVFVD